MIFFILTVNNAVEILPFLLYNIRRCVCSGLFIMGKQNMVIKQSENNYFQDIRHFMLTASKTDYFKILFYPKMINLQS